MGLKLGLGLGLDDLPTLERPTKAASSRSLCGRVSIETPPVTKLTSCTKALASACRLGVGLGLGLGLGYKG